MLVKVLKKLKLMIIIAFETKIGNRLPHIASPLKRKEYKDFFLMNADNCNIVPIVLPNIEKIGKTKTRELKYENIRKDFIIISNINKIKIFYDKKVN